MSTQRIRVQAGPRRQVPRTFGFAAAAVLAAAAMQPAPIVLTGTIAAVLALTWLWLFVVFLAAGGTPPGQGPTAVDPQPDAASADEA